MRDLVFCFFLFLLTTQVAYAEPYQLTVKQINPESWTYKGTCQTEEFCHIFMGIKPQDDAYKTDDLEVDVGVFITNSKAYFQFKSGQDYFWVTDDKKTFPIDISNESFIKKTVKLLKRTQAADSDPHDTAHKLLVIRPPSNLVAELEVTITNNKTE